MSEEGSNIIRLTDEDMQRMYSRAMDSVPYDTPGQLRDAVFGGGELCCPGCYDYNHPHADAWQQMEEWIFFSEKDWRTIE